MPKTHSFKLVLLGESAVGKSSLVLRFVKDEYSDYRESTIGAAFLTQSVGLDDDTTVKFEIWDTAGQERYRSLAPIYFRNSAAAVVVYDITQAPEASFEKAKQWVTTLHRQADPGIVIILVGNKLDLVVADPSLRRTSKEEAEEWAKEQGLLFLEASAKDGTNVDEIFMQIARKLPLSTQQSRDPTGPKGKGVKLANNGSASASACQC